MYVLIDGVTVKLPLLLFIQVAFEGISGNVEFDELGNRVNYTISIYSGQFKTLDQMVSSLINKTS